MTGGPDLLGVARRVASTFEGVAIERIVELDGTVVELRLSVPTLSADRHEVVVFIDRDDDRFAGDLRGQIRAALLRAWSRPLPLRVGDGALALRRTGAVNPDGTSQSTASSTGTARPNTRRSGVRAAQ